MILPSIKTTIRFLTLTGLIGFSAAVWAHRMDHAISTTDAQVLTLSHAFGDQPAFEPYQIFAPDSTVAFQNGRTDALGRISFLPDRPGRWRVVVTTEDGHGLEVRIRVDETLEATQVEGPARAGIMNVVAGVGYLLGLAALLVLWRQRKHNHAHP